MLTVLGGVYPSISPDVAKEDDNVDFMLSEKKKIKLILEVLMVCTIEMKTEFGIITQSHRKRT